MSEPTTWDTVHAGDIVHGHDGNLWGVATVAPHPAGPEVTLTRHGERMTARPPAGTPITVYERADLTPEATAYATLAAAFGPVDVLWESYEP